MLAVLGGIQSQAQTQKGPAPSLTSQKQIDELKSQIAALRAKVLSLETSQGDSAYRLFKLELSKDAYKSVVLDMTSRNYQRIDTDTGTFLISIEDASPYLDGYRIVLNIGNPSFAAYKGFKLTVKWNTSYKKGMDPQQWINAERTKEISFVGSLDAGSWNRVEMLLPSTTGEQLGYFVVSMETSTVSLLKK
jgi:hypothetical protein